MPEFVWSSEMRERVCVAWHLARESLVGNSYREQFVFFHLLI